MGVPPDTQIGRQQAQTTLDPLKAQASGGERGGGGGPTSEMKGADRFMQ